jgi:hypothetical protein
MKISLSLSVPSNQPICEHGFWFIKNMGLADKEVIYCSLFPCFIFCYSEYIVLCFNFVIVYRFYYLVLVFVTHVVYLKLVFYVFSHPTLSLSWCF